jgi:hypothetical protein
MHTDDTNNLGRALAEIIFGLLIAIALHLGLPRAAVARLRARMAATAEEWDALYRAWLAGRLAALDVQPLPPRRRRSIARPHSVRRAAPRARRTPLRRPSAVRQRAARPIRAAAPPAPAPARPVAASLYVPKGQPRKIRAWPAGKTRVLFVRETDFSG